LCARIIIYLLSQQDLVQPWKKMSAKNRKNNFPLALVAIWVSSEEGQCRITLLSSTHAVKIQAAAFKTKLRHAINYECFIIYVFSKSGSG
jgi:hypothetical protein